MDVMTLTVVGASIGGALAAALAVVLRGYRTPVHAVALARTDAQADGR